MWGAIIGAAISAASSYYGGLRSSEANKAANQKVADMQRENQAWYDRRYNEDPLQRTSAQRVLSRTQEMLRQRNKAAEGKAAVTGGTEESLAATKAANAEAVAEAASRIAAQGEARKDNIEQMYRGTKNALTQQQIGIEQNRANNIAQAAAGVGKAAGGLMSGLDGDKGEGKSAGEVSGADKPGTPVDSTEGISGYKKPWWMPDDEDTNWV